jgi:hypothetical protein
MSRSAPWRRVAEQLGHDVCLSSQNLTCFAEPFACRGLSPVESHWRCYKASVLLKNRVDPFRRSLYVPAARCVSQLKDTASNGPLRFFSNSKTARCRPVSRFIRVIKVREVNGKDARGPLAGGTSSGWFSQGREASPICLAPDRSPRKQWNPSPPWDPLLPGIFLTGRVCV